MTSLPVASCALSRRPRSGTQGTPVSPRYGCLRLAAQCPPPGRAGRGKKRETCVGSPSFPFSSPPPLSFSTPCLCPPVRFVLAFQVILVLPRFTRPSSPRWLPLNFSRGRLVTSDQPVRVSSSRALVSWCRAPDPGPGFRLSTCHSTACAPSKAIRLPVLLAGMWQPNRFCEPGVPQLCTMLASPSPSPSVQSSRSGVVDGQEIESPL